MICMHCGMDFDLVAKKQRAKLTGLPVGKICECLECVDSDEVRLTGAMIYAQEGAGEIQINADPRLTKLLNRRYSQTTTHSVNNGSKPTRIYNRKI